MTESAENAQAQAGAPGQETKTDSLLEAAAAEQKPAGDPGSGKPAEQKPAGDPGSGKPAEQKPAGDPNNPPGGQPPLEIPEKFKKPDGTVNHEALLKSYTELEKRLGSGEAPPKSADDYKIDYHFPEGVTIDKESEKAFLAACHGTGMSNKQVQFVMDRYADILGKQAKEQTATKDIAVAELKKTWGDSYDENLKHAVKGFNALADDIDRAALNQLGNNPAVIRMLAKVGKGLKEDNPPPPGGGNVSGEDEIQALIRSEAYFNPKHPDHQTVKNKVTSFFQKKYQKKAG